MYVFDYIRVHWLEEIRVHVIGQKHSLFGCFMDSCPKKLWSRPTEYASRSKIGKIAMCQKSRHKLCRLFIYQFVQVDVSFTPLIPMYMSLGWNRGYPLSPHSAWLTYRWSRLAQDGVDELIFGCDVLKSLFYVDGVMLLAISMHGLSKETIMTIKKVRGRKWLWNRDMT